MHEKDIDRYLGPDHPFKEIYKDVSSYHDSSVEWFRDEFGACPGNHRLIGHGSALGDAISKEEERRLREAMRKSKHFQEKFKEKTGREFTKAEEDKIIRKYKAHHKKESQRILKQIMGMGYSKEDALLILKDASNTHFLGDHTSDNSKRYISLVKPIEQILKEKIEFAKRFCSPKEYRRLKSEFMRILAIEDSRKSADAAEEFQKELGKSARAHSKVQKQVRRNRVASKHQTRKGSKRYSARIVAQRAKVRWRRALAIRAGISRISGGIGSAAMIAAPSLGGFRAGKTTMDVAFDASVMLAGYSASESASAMVAGMIGSGGAFAVAMVVQMVIAKVAYGFYEKYKAACREQRDIGVLKARIDRLNRADELLDQLVRRAMDKDGNSN